MIAHQDAYALVVLGSLVFMGCISAAETVPQSNQVVCCEWHSSGWLGTSGVLLHSSLGGSWLIGVVSHRLSLHQQCLVVVQPPPPSDGHGSSRELWFGGLWLWLRWLLSVLFPHGASKCATEIVVASQGHLAFSVGTTGVVTVAKSLQPGCTCACAASTMKH